MLHVITIRKDGESFAFGHIAEEHSTKTFCGTPIPQPILEHGINDPRNPYVDRVNVSCQECLSEYYNGRTNGYQGETIDVSETTP